MNPIILGKKKQSIYVMIGDMIGDVVVLKVNKIHWIILSLILFGCITFFGFNFSENDDSSRMDAVTTRYQILINPLGLIQGFVIGLLSAIISLQLLLIIKAKPRRHKKTTTCGEILLWFLFLLVTFIVFSFLVIIQFEQKEPLNSLLIKIVYKYSLLFAVFSSWGIIGRRIAFFRKLENQIGSWLNVLFKEPYQEKKIIAAITLSAILFFCFFPPWKGYETAVSYEDIESGEIVSQYGAGQSDFADFHFIIVNQYNVLGDAPYAIAEVDGAFQAVLISISFLVGLWLFFSVPKNHKTVREKETDTRDSHLLIDN